MRVLSKALESYILDVCPYLYAYLVSVTSIYIINKIEGKKDNFKVFDVRMPIGSNFKKQLILEELIPSFDKINMDSHCKNHNSKVLPHKVNEYITLLINNKERYKMVLVKDSGVIWVDDVSAAVHVGNVTMPKELRKKYEKIMVVKTEYLNCTKVLSKFALSSETLIYTNYLKDFNKGSFEYINID